MMEEGFPHMGTGPEALGGHSWEEGPARGAHNPLDHGGSLLGPWWRMPTSWETQARPYPSPLPLQPQAMAVASQVSPNCPLKTRWCQRTPLRPQ